jgi:hypothetical protein
MLKQQVICYHQTQLPFYLETAKCFGLYGGGSMIVVNDQNM